VILSQDNQSFGDTVSHAILITQCLQNDFVKPLGLYDEFPNLLHIGHDEARRLMGEDPPEGPIARTMKWAYEQPEEKLSIVHIRDWHDPDDPFQTEHLREFGSHCTVNSPEAEFAFKIPDPDRQTMIIDAVSINDFIDSRLGDFLKQRSDRPIKIGLIGVWTEAKIMFLAYELHTRFPNMRIAVCSALTASSSRPAHFVALGQLERILGVRVFDSISEFTGFLTDDPADVPLPAQSTPGLPKITMDDWDKVNETDQHLIKYLFRNCRSINLRALSGGFSGNLVLGSESVDLHGLQQVPHVVKIGPHGPIGQERTAFEQVESVLGNNAPNIVDFADMGGRGALKYRYAAMGGGFSTTFQERYCGGLTKDEIENYLSIVFKEQLGRFYKAGEPESANLLEHYGIVSEYAEPIKKRIEEVLGTSADTEYLQLPTGHEFHNPYYFYRDDLPKLATRAISSAYFSYIHGDLNGANIIIDTHDNVWLIDFFHTGPGHILKDMIKLENDILYIYTPVNNKEDLAEAVRLTDSLLRVGDLARTLPEVDSTGLSDPHMRQTYETIRYLRTFYPPLIHDDRNPLQLFIALLRYAGHTLSFDESNDWQKKWALYTAGKCCYLIKKRLRSRGPIRIDWLDTKYTGNGKLGMTLLPGRKDYSRSLREDLKTMKENNVTHVVTMLTHNEFGSYGVSDLLKNYEKAGFNSRYFPILNQGVSSVHGMREMVQWIDDILEGGGNVMLHCVGGLGRSGLVAACYLVSKGLDADSAIQEVRRSRSPRAIESKVQEKFVREFTV